MTDMNEPVQESGEHLGREARSVASEVPAAIPAREAGGQARVAAPANRRGVPRARRMKLSLTHVDPWSVAKVSFLLAIAGAIIQIVAVALIWALLEFMGLFNQLTQMMSNTGLNFNLGSMLQFGTVISAVTIFSIFEVVLVMVLATIGAFLYNVVCALVGGVHVTLGDD
ncbi:DUF3566 domain-containing protein [Bifidobacterium vespertilionis]|uniref:DUF3566 domain-containing protein n=1 Tax=Bifidobacterium vespertilionis TaxID=2562524 RepID=A0A5J5DTS2_9BIFI|nr:DUF3566 domain-containing protein [Bifidobacterium vespertilionis]KAA8818636.1 DUF3566 domain-containing protein [Bifidobacterium vespertilionis]KAA8823091.1 DUF3566 domain-containing protein [Bifidobacterium vespertilionis]MBT1178940.1 DUF3566 domain-containing protein [Bifidobacterium vespertilionis]